MPLKTREKPAKSYTQDDDSDDEPMPVPKKQSSKKKAKPEKKQKKQKKVKDPNAPKRPMSAYFLFMNSVRPEVRKDNPDSTIGEIAIVDTDFGTHLIKVLERSDKFDPKKTKTDGGYSL